MRVDDLWSKVLATPGDEELKDVFGAALMVAHDPRAETLRLADELKRFPVYYVQHEGIKKAYLQSLAAWDAALAGVRAATGAEIEFVGGWPIEVTIRAADFVRHAKALVARVPVRHLNVLEVAEAPEVFGVRELRQIVSIDGHGQRWTIGAVRALAKSPHLEALRWLDLSRAQLTAAEVEVLAGAQNLRRLHHLDLRENDCPDPVDAAAGYGTDGNTGMIVFESIYLPEFGTELEARHGKIYWLHALDHYLEKHPPSRYLFTAAGA